MSTRQHLLRFPATLPAFGRASNELREWLDAHGLSGNSRYNVELAFEEVVTNIIRYGATRSDVDVLIELASGETRLIFEDDGTPFDPSSLSAPTLPTTLDDAAGGGLGVMLVKHAASRMTYERTDQARNRLEVVIR